MTRDRTVAARLRMMLTALALWASSGVTGAAALECFDERFEDTGFAICRVDMAADELRLWHLTPEGTPFYSLGALADAIRDKGGVLGFAMNAGMYHPDRAPVGLLVIDGNRTGRLITSPGPGNFGMLPNGVFCWGDRRGAVIESRAFARDKPECRYATQSGPMLVIGGRLHPRLLPEGTSLRVRNGVGVSADGRHAVFAISKAPVNFHRFARFFRDRLEAPDALYLDGAVSRMLAPGIGLNDRGGWFGPILGVVEKAD
jgi:uncharacterized protein YigE (DUF2233 family)